MKETVSIDVWTSTWLLVTLLYQVAQPASLYNFVECLKFGTMQISDLVFEVIKSEMLPKKPKRDRFMGLAPLAEIGKKEPKLLDSNGFKVDPKPLKKRSTTTISRDKFLTVVCDALKQYQYLGPKQRADLMVACR